MSVLQFILNCTLCAMFMHIAAGEHIAQRYCVEFIVLGPDSDDDARHQALQLSSFTPLPAIIPFCSHLHQQHHQHHLLHHPHQGIIRYSLTQHPSLLSPALMMQEGHFSFVTSWASVWHPIHGVRWYSMVLDGIRKRPNTWDARLQEKIVMMHLSWTFVILS